MPTPKVRHARLARRKPRSSEPEPSDERNLSDWLPRVAGAFQKLILLARAAHIEHRLLEEQLARVPAPKSPLESLIIRSFIDDCLIAVYEGGGNHSPTLQRRFADLMIAVHRDQNPLAELSRALGSLCSLDTDTVLANAIKVRLEEGIDRRITARTIAEEYGLRRAQLDRVFRGRFGVGFCRFVTSMRVKRGLALVMSGMKVEDAAVGVGYKSKKDFYRAVRDETGSTPGKLRRTTGPDAGAPELALQQGTLFGLS
jgi:AraC-like DNA-binding protein